jgi:hypothetical protein
VTFLALQWVDQTEWLGSVFMFAMGASPEEYVVNGVLHYILRFTFYHVAHPFVS